VPSKSAKPILFAVPTVAVVAVANGRRPEVATSLVAYGKGGMMKSLVDVAVPSGVVMLTRPEPVLGGTVPVSEVDDPLESCAYATLNRVRSFASTASKLVPVSVTVAPARPVVGVKLVMVGARLVVTTKGEGPEADPAGVVTPTVPVVAPVGTDTINCVAVALETAADVPLSETAF